MHIGMLNQSLPAVVGAHRLGLEAVVLVALDADHRIDAAGLQHLDGDGRHDARPLRSVRSAQ